MSLSKFKAVQAKLNATINTGQIASATNQCRTYLPHITLTSKVISAGGCWDHRKSMLNPQLVESLSWCLESRCLMTQNLKWVVAPSDICGPSSIALSANSSSCLPSPGSGIRTPKNHGKNRVCSWQNPIDSIVGRRFLGRWNMRLDTALTSHVPKLWNLFVHTLRWLHQVVSQMPPLLTVENGQKFKHLFPGDVRKKTGWISAISMELFCDTEK